MNAPCEVRLRVQASLDEREEDRLTREGREWLEGHLEACDGCRREALARDPTLAFWSMSGDEPDVRGGVGRGTVVPFPSSAAAGSVGRDGLLVAGEVLAAIELQLARERLRPRRVGLLQSRRDDLRARPVLLAAACLALVGAGLAGFWPSLRERGSRSTEVAGSPRERTARVVSEASAVGTANVANVPNVANVAKLRGSAHPPIETVSSPGATILQFAATTPDGPTVVFIVDRNADI